MSADHEPSSKKETRIDTYSTFQDCGWVLVDSNPSQRWVLSFLKMTQKAEGVDWSVVSNKLLVARFESIHQLTTHTKRSHYIIKHHTEQDVETRCRSSSGLNPKMMLMWQHESIVLSKATTIAIKVIKSRVDKLPDGPLFVHIMFIACDLINSLLLPNIMPFPSTPVSFTRQKNQVYPSPLYKKTMVVFSPRLSWSPDKSHDLLETSLLASATPCEELPQCQTQVMDPKKKLPPTKM